MSEERLLQHALITDADGHQTDVKHLSFKKGLQHHVHHSWEDPNTTGEHAEPCIYSFLSELQAYLVLVWEISAFCSVILQRKTLMEHILSAEKQLLWVSVLKIFLGLDKCFCSAI